MDQIAPPLPSPPPANTKRKNAVEKMEIKMLEKRKGKIDIMRKQLEIESALEEKSLKRVWAEWEKIHADYALQDLRNEIDLWEKKTETLLARKDKKIEILFNSLEDTYELEIRSISKFCDQLDYISKCHRALKQAALNIYEMLTFELVYDFLLHPQNEQMEQFEVRVNSYEYARNVKQMSTLLKNHENFMATRFETVSLEVAQRESLRDSTLKNMRALQDRLLTWIKNLKEQTLDVDRPIKYMRLMRRQRKEVGRMHSLGEVEQACRKQIMELKEELLTIELNKSIKIFALQQELDYFKGIKSTMKDLADRNTSMEKNKLLVTANESYDVIKTLKEIVKKGELLLQLASNCRKYETLGEQIAPFKDENPSLRNENFKFELTYDLVKLCDISKKEIAKQMQYMKYFWYRSSKVGLHNIMLKDDKRKLTEENEKYRNIIRTMKLP